MSTILRATILTLLMVWGICIYNVHSSDWWILPGAIAGAAAFLLVAYGGDEPKRPNQG